LDLQQEWGFKATEMWRNTTAKYARGFHMTFIDIVCFFYVVWCLLNFIVVGGFNPSEKI